MEAASLLNSPLVLAQVYFDSAFLFSLVYFLGLFLNAVN